MTVRLALITSYAQSICNFRASLVRDLVGRGVRVYALAPDYDAEIRAAVMALGAEPIDCSLSRVGMNPLRDAVDMVRLTRLLRRLKPDLTLGYFIKPVIYGTLAAAAAGVPTRYALIEGAGYAFTDDGSLGIKRRLLRAAIVRLYRLGLSRVDRAFFLNDDDVALFTGHGMVAADKVVRLTGIGVELNEFPMVAATTEPVTFILVARLLAEKGIREYVAAARRIKAKHPHTRFLLLGGTDPNPGAIPLAEVRRWVAEGVIEWPGHVPDVRPWLRQASVFVLPSYREGLPRSTQEAMASGLPVITTDAPGCRETVVNGRNGFLVPVRDVDALAAAMERFVLEPALIESMGWISHRMAEEMFDARKINRTIIEALGLAA